MNITLTPALQRFVDGAVKSGRYTDRGEVVRAALRRLEAQELADGLLAKFTALGQIAGGDIEAAAFAVLMESAKSMQEDLKAIMAQVKAINLAKRALRELIGQVSRDVAANAGCASETRALDFSRGLGSERAYHRARLPCLDPDAPGGVRSDRADLHPGRITQAATLQGILDELQSKLDSLSEMGEMESLRLQMAMDRRSKLMSTLSNLLARLADTSAALVQNLK